VKILGYSEDGHALVELTAEEVKVWDAADKAAASVALGIDVPQARCICRVKGVADLTCPVHGINGTRPFEDGQQ
jgi:hypothetical protein